MLAIPLSAISGAFGGMTGVVVTWIGIVGVNVTQAVRLNPGLFQRSGRATRTDPGPETGPEAGPEAGRVTPGGSAGPRPAAG